MDSDGVAGGVKYCNIEDEVMPPINLSAGWRKICKTRRQKEDSCYTDEVLELKLSKDIKPGPDAFGRTRVRTLLKNHKNP